jgi:hypothetical protein
MLPVPGHGFGNRGRSVTLQTAREGSFWVTGRDAEKRMIRAGDTRDRQPYESKIDEKKGVNFRAADRLWQKGPS